MLNQKTIIKIFIFTLWLDIIKTLTTIDIYYDPFCEHCISLFGKNLNSFLKNTKDINDFDFKLHPYALASYYKAD